MRWRTMRTCGAAAAVRRADAQGTLAERVRGAQYQPQRMHYSAVVQPQLSLVHNLAHFFHEEQV